MDEQSQFVVLRCEACGGKLNVPKQYTFETGDGIFVMTGENTFTCQHCDTEYLPKQSLERFVPGSGVIISGIVGGNVSIGNIVTGDVPGNVVGGNIVMGNRVIDEETDIITSNKDDFEGDDEKKAAKEQKAQADIVTSNEANLEDDESETLKEEKNVNHVPIDSAKEPRVEPGKTEPWFNIISRWFRKS